MKKRPKWERPVVVLAIHCIKLAKPGNVTFGRR